jgi:hypothetical protein
LILTEDDIRQLGWEKEYREWVRKFEELKKKTSKVSDVKHGLSILEKANADPNLILEAPTGIVWDLPTSWRKQMKRDQAKLCSCSKRPSLCCGGSGEGCKGSGLLPRKLDGCLKPPRLLG